MPKVSILHRCPASVASANTRSKRPRGSGVMEGWRAGATIPIVLFVPENPGCTIKSCAAGPLSAPSLHYSITPLLPALFLVKAGGVAVRFHVVTALFLVLFVIVLLQAR